MTADVQRNQRKMTLYLHSLLSPMLQEKAIINTVSKSTTYWSYNLFLGTEPFPDVRAPFLSKLHLPFYLHQSMYRNLKSQTLFNRTNSLKILNFCILLILSNNSTHNIQEGPLRPEKKSIYFSEITIRPVEAHITINIDEIHFSILLQTTDSIVTIISLPKPVLYNKSFNGFFSWGSKPVSYWIQFAVSSIKFL